MDRRQRVAAAGGGGETASRWRYKEAAANGGHGGGQESGGGGRRSGRLRKDVHRVRIGAIHVTRQVTNLFITACRPGGPDNLKPATVLGYA
ncbi:hypothetical protein E2562_029570 [Oryza meyeriana var. granulata]|uniref:Uncharacterized protein n=1 Tax=Oryza meyeriana var. granulata TaxID=110450 RepID=A0A6G1C9K2_9ORYZ|nr:hypothetical protein E2562_029570 [Oryza meyeriana var. granulata]